MALVAPLVPQRRVRRGHRHGRKPIPDRAILTGILYVLRSGVPWQMLPKEMGCGSGSTCWRRLVRWQRASGARCTSGSSRRCGGADDSTSAGS
jgi:transposase